MSERRTLNQTISVPFEYPVIFTRNVFSPGNTVLVELINRRQEPLPHRCVVFIDANVVAAIPPLPGGVTGYFETHRQALDLVAPPLLVPGGEIAKNGWPLVEQSITTLLAHKLCRHSFVVVIGGGSVLDAVGLATALVHRGLRLIRLPTTVLAQNDAGVGVKNAINCQGIKNVIGTFAPPFGVINDLEFLRTLPDSAWTDGITEAFKVAIIKDAAFFEFLCAQARALAAHDQSVMEELIYRCAQLHLDHIRSSGDPFEVGHARPLDFGHWSAHKLEAMSDYQVRHGQAVALGIMLDSFYAVQKGWLPESVAERLYQGLTQSGLVLWHELLERRAADGSLELLQGLDDFQEHLGGELNITFPHSLGRRLEVHEIDPVLVENSVRQLKQRHHPTHHASPC
jgi:3-dehydroquinate synthase